MWVQAALFAAQLWLGELTRQRPKRTSFEEFQKNNQPSEIRPIPYAGGTVELTPSRAWYGDYRQRAVERDSHWTDYLWAGALAALLDFITVAYRSYVGEMFPLCWGPDTHVERITIDDRPVFAVAPGTDNAGGGFLIDDPQAWGGDQPPGGGGEYAWCDLTRGNYTDHANAYLESLLSVAPNKTPALHGISALVKRGPSGFEESGYFFAGGVGSIPKLKLWKVTVRRQPDNLATGFNKIGRHMNPMETIYEWSTSLEFGARIPLEELNLPNWRQVAQDLAEEDNGWSGVIEDATSPIDVVKDILAQIDAMADPSPSLGLTIRLIRRDYSFGSLRVLNRDNVTRVDRFAPGTYEDTKNKVQVEFPDHDNNFKGRKALYTDPANQLIQNGRVVPETKTFLGVADFEQGNTIATRDGRAISLPRAPLECYVFASFGRLTYRGEVLILEWSSPTFSIVMRVLAITPNGPDERDYRLVLIEDQFSTGLRTFGEPGASEHVDPGAGMDTAPPSATWNTTDFPTAGLKLTLTLTNTNQFVPMIEGGIVFGSYAPGGQYARIYVTEPGGVQTLSPIYLAPDANSEATFTWPANAVGTYEFCVQTYSLRGVTNGVKVCADIDIANIGSPSISPSSSVSPSPSASVSPSSSESPSTSASISPSPSVSPSVSSSPSASLSPSASTSPSSSASPSGPPPTSIIFMAGAEHEASTTEKWTAGGNPPLNSSISGAHGRYYDNLTQSQTVLFPAAHQTLTVRCRFQVRQSQSGERDIFKLLDGTNSQIGVSWSNPGNFAVVRGASTVLAVSSGTEISLNTWYWAELAVVIADVGGSYTAKLYDDSGTTLVTHSSGSADTQESANASADRLRGGETNVDTVLDNISVSNAFEILGRCRVETLYGNAAGDLAQWTRGGTDTGANFSQVNDAVKEGTEWIQSSAADQFDFYNMQPRVLAGTPLAVQVNALGRRITGGANPAQFKLAQRIGGVTYEGGVTQGYTSTAGDVNAWEVWNTNPDTGNVWSDAEIDSLQFGVKSLTGNVAIADMAVEVLVQI